MKFVKSIFTVCSYRVYLHFDHHLTTTVQSPLKMPEKPVVITNNGLFPILAANVQKQQILRFNVGLYRPVVVLRSGRPEVRILPVAPRAAPYGVLLFQFVKEPHHQAAQQPSAASKIQKYFPKACKQRRFHAQFASFFRFMAANLSLTHCVTRVRPLMWV